ncbi:hypothetical protein HKX48_006132 [Thoreauomyces humboldtii]|nr:hypothetical protein HKX48_006132 [Thoreauomyces humboldtii]
MSYWSEERPTTAKVFAPDHRRLIPGEHEREVDRPSNVWHAATPPFEQPPVSTFTADFTRKPVVPHVQQRQPIVKDESKGSHHHQRSTHATELWVLRGEQELRKRGGTLHAKEDGNGGDPKASPAAEDPREQFETTHHRDFQIPGFDPTVSGVAAVKVVLEPEEGDPAGLPTAQNDSTVTYSSSSLTDLLAARESERQHRGNYGRHTEFVPRSAESQRSGRETFSDYREGNGKMTRGEDARRRQEIIGRTVGAGTAVGVAGK